MSQNPIEQKERQPLNMRTNYEKTVDAMGEVEGDIAAWKETLRHARENTPETAREALNKYVPHEPAPGWENERNPIVHTIYGVFGTHRWYVHADGSVEFSAFHAKNEVGGESDAVRKAEALGFSINRD